jgi:hypothetical protein
MKSVITNIFLFLFLVLSLNAMDSAGEMSEEINGCTQCSVKDLVIQELTKKIETDAYMREIPAIPCRIYSSGNDRFIDDPQIKNITFTSAIAHRSGFISFNLKKTPAVLVDQDSYFDLTKIYQWAYEKGQESERKRTSLQIIQRRPLLSVASAFGLGTVVSMVGCYLWITYQTQNIENIVELLKASIKRYTI